MPPVRRAPGVTGARAAPALRRRAARPAARLGLRGLTFVLLTIGLLFAQGNRLLHEVLVRHALCEHGQLIHEETAPAVPTAQGKELGDRGVAVSQGNAPGHDAAAHDHCDARSVLHRIADLGPSVAPASLLPVNLPAQLAGDRACPPIAQLHLAPKSSPPA